MIYGDVEWRAVSPAQGWSRRMAFSPSLGSLVLFCVVGSGIEQWVWDDDRFVRRQRRPFDGKGFALLTPENGEPTPLQLHEDGIFDACALGTDVYAVRRDGAVLRLDGDSLSPVADPLPGMDDFWVDHLSLVVADHENGRLVAVADKGQGHHFVPSTGWEPGPRIGPLGHGLMWNSLTRRPEVLRGGGNVGPWAEPEPWGEERVPTKVYMPGGWYRLPLAVDEATGQWALLEAHRLLRRSPGGEWREQLLPLALPDGPDMVSVGGTLMALSVKDVGDVWLDGDRWVKTDAPTSSFYLHAAAKHGTVTLDERGALSHTIDGRTDEIAAPCDALTGIDEIDDELALICDRDRVVLWHGRKHRTWVVRQGAWTQVNGGGPPKGTGVFCSTPVGLFYVDEEDRPFLFDDSDRWQRLASLGEGIRLLFCRPTAPALWAMTPEGLAVWRDDAFQPVAALPEEAVAAENAPYGSPCDTWYDPKGDRVLLTLSGGMWELPVPDERGGFPFPQTPLAGDEPAPEPSENRSCYVLEASIRPGGGRQGLLFALPDLESIHGVIDELVLDDSVDARMQRDLLAMGGTLTLWIVQEGLLTEGIDLKPHLNLDELTIDWNAVAAATPTLRGNLMDVDGVSIRIGDFVPEFTYIQDDELLEYGANDPEGGGIPGIFAPI
ncbi:hypothetical protein HDA40_001803 [Hamadaea flava]|uniref:Uncharacterized protein n=1 Tax=Hamadaea flava TaxID=1742688 RepID=A0ABV8LM95_9ACTN|nr:hypothetical protein [Hamadaea flava]MCP2323296.1 hypothetical protein [Hamadaea flava]